ncbi:MAG: sialidase family protein [Egibacteraceae bacterium]
MTASAATPTAAPERASDPGRRWLAGLLAAALLALGAGLGLVGMSLGTAPRVVEANTPVNAGAADPLDITAHNSPTLVADPTDADRLVVVNRIDTPSFSCALHTSTDAGQTWAASQIPFPAGEERPERCFAPDAAFAADGTLHVSFVTLAGRGNTPNAAWVATSADADGGVSFGEPVQVTGPGAFQLRLAADPAEPARLYLSWVHAGEVGPLGFPGTANPVRVARSDDAGATWTDPVAVTDPHRRVLAPTSVVGDDGTVYTLYLDVGDDRLDYHGGHEGRGGPAYPGPWRLLLARSSDGGATWTDTLVDDALVPTGRVVAFFPPSPSLVVDGGRVYAGFHDARAGDADVWVWTSHDAGATFADPVRVPDLGAEDATDQYLPALAVAPGGRLDVIYYDRRADPANIMNEVSLQSSHDHGASFTPSVRLSDRAFDSRVGLGSERDLPDLGSRLGLVATDRTAHAVWADTRTGTQASNKQDLAHATAAMPATSPRRLLLGASVALLLAGLALLARTATSRRRPAP